MRAEFVLEMDTNYERPVVKIDGFSALIDTGARLTQAMATFLFVSQIINNVFAIL